MLVYEKKVDDKRHLFGTMGNVPAQDDVQLTYKDNDGDVLTDLTLNETYLDDGKGGIIRKSDDKEINVFIGDTCIIGKVEEPQVKSLTIKTAPTKVEYVEGQALDLTGLVLEATMEDGDKKEITSGYTTVPEDGSALAVGTTKVEITYSGKTVEQAITVEAKALESITLALAKTNFTVGEELDLSEAVVTGTYNDGTEANVTAQAEFDPANGTVLTAENDKVTATVGELNSSVEITVGE